MIEKSANLWDLPSDTYKCITTNGFVKNSGQAVMGRGCALEAKNRFPDMPFLLGGLIRQHGNNVYLLNNKIFSFPVKHHWAEEADVNLIIKSANQLLAIINAIHISEVYVPRPGCGNGKQKWSDVKSVLVPIWDDRFIVLNKEV